MNDIIMNRANKIKKKKKLVKIIKLSLLISTLALLLSYFVIGLIYNNGNFTSSFHNYIIHYHTSF